MQRKRIHTRTVVVDVYDEGDGAISIEGRLTDEQPLDSGYFQMKRRANDPRPPGTLHGMTASMRIDQRTNEIVKTDGAFPGRPYEGCAAVLGWLGKLDGLKITTGYTQASKERLGGPNGCAHMNTLLQVMANTRGASGAYFLSKERVMEQRLRFDPANPYVHPAINSCHMWRGGGPILTSMAQGKNSIEEDL
jgi:hypothetical protein